MPAKKVISTVLLLFVILSIAYLVIKETGPQKDTAQKIIDASMSETVSPSAGTTRENNSGETGHKVLVYYFYGNMRCPTCRKFEAYAHEALQSTFPEELKSGILEWRLVNIDEPSNEHFIQDYDISSRSLVVVDMEGKKQTNWKNLKGIWDLVEDKESFLKYVKEETQIYLEGSV
jgi:thiol-disulfide isomerase/thioredoxin